MKFQSTLPREERPYAPRTICVISIFQSTLPREERPSQTGFIKFCGYFNPRSHERSDGAITVIHHRGALFQSTLPREERPFRHAPFTFKGDISIHAPTRGATGYRLLTYTFHHISIHAPTRGATSFPFCQSAIAKISIHAPTRGATET